MASAIADIIANGSWVDVDLLIALPGSTDRGAFLRPSWRGYQPVAAQIQVVDMPTPAGIQFFASAQWLPTEGAWEVVAVAVSFRGSLLFVAPLPEPRGCSAGQVFPVRINGSFNAVL